MTDHMDLPFEEALDRCLARVLAGEPLDAVLRDHADMAGELRPLLAQAAALHAVSIPEPSAAARTAAMSRMLAASRDEAEHYQPAGVLAWLGSLRARPLAFQAIAAAVALAVLGSAGLGASAATGTTPEPIRIFFRLPDTSVSATATPIPQTGASSTDATPPLKTPEANRTEGPADGHADGTPGSTDDRRGTPDSGEDHRGTPGASDDRRGTPGAGDGRSSTPGASDDHGDTPGVETPSTEDGHTAVPDGGHEGTPPLAEETSTHSEDGGHSGPSATQTPEPTEAHDPTEAPSTESPGGG